MEKKIDTPYYVVHKSIIEEEFYKLKYSLEKYWGNFTIGYSYKTNALPWIITYMEHLGSYAEVVSEDEYSLAQMVGVPTTHIIYNGPIKKKESFQEAILRGAIVNIDSQRELEWLEELPTSDNYKVGLRVNFDIEKYCPGQSQCPQEGGRFGFCYENGELGKAINRLESKGFRIAGLHLHTSSKTRGIDIYETICKIACMIKEQYGLQLSYIDVGGGFFGGLPEKPQFDDYLAVMSRILSKSFSSEKTAIIVEPGMAFIGAAISYVTSVIDIKRTTYNQFVVTDGTRTSIDPLMTKISYFHRYVKKNSTEKVEKQVICGYTCMEHDRLYIAEQEERLEIGDKIIYEKVGAYTMCLTPLFIKYFPSVYVEENAQLYCIRKKWTPKEYIQGSAVWSEVK